MTFENDLSAVRHREADTKWQAYRDAAKACSLKPPEDSRFIQAALAVFSHSEFIVNNCIRNPELLIDLCDSGDLFNRRASDYLPDILNQIGTDVDVASLGAGLCRLKRREMVRIAWRDLAGWADLDETMADLSASISSTSR